ncbi:hypothetical protein B0H63DRAFT_99197 [Podospora didyma]|uniref:Zn(2)-C6 fungal-type domain-containing protein n=1 Tax=Podospora didyma TaxID=330526 RepID=A0AAE0U3B9_9PEZI|nr:hypothetical protein B0H63DRAFT_99197 [Podospora didyma]
MEMVLDMEVDQDADVDTAASTTSAGTGNGTSTGGPGSATSTTTKLAEPRRRNRPALSCIQCRTRKIRCDRNEPCASCLKSKIVNCTYEEARRPKPRLWRLSPAPAPGSAPSDISPPAEDVFSRVGLGHAPTSGSVPGPPPGSGFTFREVQPLGSLSGLQYATSAASLPSVRSSDSASIPSPASRQLDSTPGVSTPSSTTPALADRVRQLEQQLADALKRPSHASQYPQQPHPSAVPSLSKTRYFGSSHWVNGTKPFPLLISIGAQIDRDKNSEVYFLLQKCKSLGKSIKAQRVPAQVGFDVGRTIPTESIARRLVDAYFRTIEGVYRILHVPTFWQEYRRYWQSPESASKGFVVQFQLCMAIGTCFQDDVTSLRHSAIQWVYEAQAWFVSPSEKSRMNLAGLQTMCLLHLAREACGVSGDLVWISAGALMRTAMHMGLHRDPDSFSGMSTFRSEMRRRLWATILEIALQSSLDSGGPPLVALADFDTHAPSNFDDDQLADDENFSSVPRPLSTFTQTTVQLALLRSFPTRLAIAQYVNHFNSPVTYEETLKWNSELTSACRALSATLQPSYDPAGVLPKRLSLFQLRLAEHMVHRFFMALNHPWLCSAQHNPAYYFARKMCVETSLKLYRAFATGSPAGDSGTASPTDDFTRLATCGHGAFRSVPTLAVLTICLELLWQVQEDRSFRQSMIMDHQLDKQGPGSETDVGASGGIGSGAAPRQDLFEALRYSIGWAERRIQNGETNIKGYLMWSALLTQIQAVQRGASDAEVERIVMNSIIDELRKCWHLLKDSTGMSTPPGLNSGFDDLRLGFGNEWASEDLAQMQGFSSLFNFDDGGFFVDG